MCWGREKRQKMQNRPSPSPVDPAAATRTTDAKSNERAAPPQQQLHQRLTLLVYLIGRVCSALEGLDLQQRKWRIRTRRGADGVVERETVVERESREEEGKTKI